MSLPGFDQLSDEINWIWPMKRSTSPSLNHHLPNVTWDNMFWLERRLHITCEAGPKDKCTKTVHGIHIFPESSLFIANPDCVTLRPSVMWWPAKIALKKTQLNSQSAPMLLQLQCNIADLSQDVSAKGIALSSYWFVFIFLQPDCKMNMLPLCEHGLMSPLPQ